MGKTYATTVLGIKKPKIGISNILLMLGVVMFLTGILVSAMSAMIWVGLTLAGVGVFLRFHLQKNNIS